MNLKLQLLASPCEFTLKMHFLQFICFLQHAKVSSQILTTRLRPEMSFKKAEGRLISELKRSDNDISAHINLLYTTSNRNKHSRFPLRVIPLYFNLVYFYLVALCVVEI